MKIKIPASPYFSPQVIRTICKDGKIYLGCWSIETKYNDWSDNPIDVFYEPYPDLSKGHSNYMGLYITYPTNQVMVCDASSAFSSNITCIVEEDVVYTSRYRHDYVKTPSGLYIDGGRDYLHTNCTDFASLCVRDGKFFVYRDNVHGYIPVYIEYEVTNGNN